MVTREGSMSAAAEQLGYARSTVTGHIQSLERTFGVKLFDRHSPGNPLTASGRTLLQYADNILDSVRRARAAVAEANEGGASTLRLGATGLLCTYRLPLFLRMMSRFIPDLKVEVETAGVTRLREQVRSGRPSVVLVPATRDRQTFGPPESRSVARRVLWEEEAILVGTPDAAAHPTRVLLTGRDCLYREITDSNFLDKLPATEPIQVGSMEAVKSAVIAGLGVGLLPMVSVQYWLSQGHLVALPYQPNRKVVTEVVWNSQACPAGVVEHLERLHTAPVSAGA